MESSNTRRCGHPQVNNTSWCPDCALAEDEASRRDRTSQAPVPQSEPPTFSLAQSVSTLRWILNITTEFDRKDVRTRQAARLLDEFCSADGTWNRQHLENLWEWLSTRESAVPQREPLTDAQLNEMAFQYGLVAEGYWSEDAIAFAREVAALSVAQTATPQGAKTETSDKAFRRWADAEEKFRGPRHRPDYREGYGWDACAQLGRGRFPIVKWEKRPDPKDGTMRLYAAPPSSDGREPKEQT